MQGAPSTTRAASEFEKDDARTCPWCGRLALKNDACNWVTCGLADAPAGFVVGAGCGHQWCFLCEGKLCGQVYDAITGAKRGGVADTHTATCCAEEPGFSQQEFCPGGHNSHCPKRW